MWNGHKVRQATHHAFTQPCMCACLRLPGIYTAVPPLTGTKECQLCQRYFCRKYAHIRHKQWHVAHTHVNKYHLGVHILFCNVNGTLGLQVYYKYVELIVPQRKHTHTKYLKRTQRVHHSIFTKSKTLQVCSYDIHGL